MTCSPWPEEHAEGREIAQLALLRLLWLQREAHRATRAGLSEAVALLARSAIETCITGLYCLIADEAPAKLTAQNAYQFRAMLRYLPEEFIPESIREPIVASVGTPDQGPNIFAMAQAVDRADQSNTATMLYRAYYAPLSTLYAHGGGIALLRHVGRGGRATERPAKPWFHRSALHIIDSSVALLASHAARGAGDATAFDAYYEAHRGRTITPLFAVGGRNFTKAIRLPALPASLRAARHLKAYLASDVATTDPPTEVDAKVRDLVAQCFACLRQPAGGDQLVEAFTEMVVELSRNAPPQQP